MKDDLEPALYVDIAEMIDDHRYEQAMAEAALQQTVQLTRIADAVERLATSFDSTLSADDWFTSQFAIRTVNGHGEKS